MIKREVVYDQHPNTATWIMSRTSQYAIQALTFMAIQPFGTLVTVYDIASQLNVPAAYLAKIMQSLNKAKFLSTQRGRHGGIYLHAGAETVGLLEILAYTERGSLVHDCLLGLKTCSDETACPIHGTWQPIKQAIIDLLEECTLQRLAEDVRSGRYQLSNLPHELIESRLSSEAV